MNDHDVENAITAGLQAANDHTALDAEWLRKFTRGVLAHHFETIPPVIDEERPLTAEEHAFIDKGWADYVDVAARNGPRDDA